MKMVNRIILLSLVVIGLVVVSAGVASAQDVYKVNYFDFNSPTLGGFPVPDATVHIDNPGLTYGNLCAMIYVFAADQQLTECCSCFISPNALLQFSVNNDLTGNPVTGVKSTAGDIKVTSSFTANKCTVSETANGQTLNIAVAGQNYNPIGSLRVWGTHSRPTAPGLVTVTEVPFIKGELDPDGTELQSLQTRCFNLQSKGTLAGRCTCPSESVNGSK